jgi:hypothetical protein
MASILHTDMTSLVQRLNAGLERDLETTIRNELMKNAQAVVAEVARDMAQRIRGSIRAYTDTAGGGLQISIVLDGVTTPVPPKD